MVMYDVEALCPQCHASWALLAIRHVCYKSPPRVCPVLDFWPQGGDVAISGLNCKVLSAKILKTGQVATVTQDGFRTHITGLPEAAPDAPVTTIALECDAVPEQDVIKVRTNKPRAGVGI